MPKDLSNTYRIVRMFFDDRPTKIVVRGLTLEQAQTHCRRDDTHGGSTDDGSAWFDGYEEER